MNRLGTISRTTGGGTILHYERDIAKRPAGVWAALTESRLLKNWLGTVEVELKLGGKFIIRFHQNGDEMTGAITALEAEKLLEYSWSENCGLPISLVRWTLRPRGDGSCRLTLTHILPPGCESEDIVSFGGGWHAFLDGAEAVVLGGDGLAAVNAATDALPGLEKAYAGLAEEAPLLAIDGTLTEAEVPLVRFERLIGRPVAKVWAALTDPQILRQWLGEVEVEPRLGGKYVLRFRDSDTVMTGAITAFEPERVLEFSWSESDVPVPPSHARWELSPAPQGCRLVLTHRFAPGVARRDMVPFLGGWEGFLDVIERGADGTYVAYRPWGPYDVRYRAKYP
ncbi:MAG: SRPBCC family protein [Rhizomicrobium sp.]